MVLPPRRTRRTRHASRRQRGAPLGGESRGVTGYEGTGPMKQVSRRLALGGVALTGGLALAACGAVRTSGGSDATTSKEPVTVQILDRNPGDALIPDYDKIFQRFTQAHPTVEVERVDT